MGGAVSGYLRLLRPVNCVMTGFAVLVGAAIAGRSLSALGVGEALAGFAAGFFIAGAAMVFNDYADREIDMINAPGRPIPSGAVNPASALAYGAFLVAGGLAAAAYTGLGTLAAAAAAAALAVLYDFWGKRTGLPGNLMVSFNVALPILYGALLVGRADLTIMVYWAMIFLANTSREVVKGIADVEGDSVRGVRTLAVVLGERRAALVAVATLLVAIALSPVPVFWGDASQLYIPLVAAADAGFLYSSARLLARPEKRVALRVKNEMLVWMLLGLIAFLAGSLW